jgi:hypothetical protein
VFQVSRTRFFEAPPATVFSALSDPSQLATLIPRVQRIEFLSRNDSVGRARIATYMAFGPFGDIRSEGDVRWLTDREVIFKTDRPAVVEARWMLEPATSGTNVSATLQLDLKPMLGPLAQFIPPDQVTGMLGPDLDAAMNELHRRLNGHTAT